MNWGINLHSIKEKLKMSAFKPKGMKNLSKTNLTTLEMLKVLKQDPRNKDYFDFESQRMAEGGIMMLPCWNKGIKLERMSSMNKPIWSIL